MNNIREYILLHEAGRPKKKIYSREARRQWRRKHYRGAERIRKLKQMKRYRRKSAYKKQQRLYKRKFGRSSYRPTKRIYH